MKMEKLRNVFEYIKEDQRIVSDGFVQIVFRNLGSVPVSVSGIVLNPGDTFSPVFYGGTYQDETFYEIKFATGGSQILLVIKTYLEL
ncbi:hypothetical protein [Raineya orbicola]|jgi:hypothetical protein|uniref:Uncharacterized protein n=1 Tax=Raineya orbicola TaxID=2016530 RepID=A0A2N3I6V0_9BACT|nr:hypothetical protein [Raineya orbicola]PKQ66054.1 hypothetical protein Rain11_2483 [Raineya orbicola]